MKKALLTAALCITGCSQTPPPPPAPPVAETPAPQPPEPAPMPIEAPKAAGSLAFIAGSDIKAALEGSGELARHDLANGIAARCGAVSTKSHAGEAGKFEEIKAEPLKIGALPERLRRGAFAELVYETRVWQVESQGVDFYKTLSDGNPNGLKFDTPAAACLRYSLYRPGSPELYSDMLFSVSFNPKKPEILSVMPVRIYFRDFAALADQSGSTQAATKVTLGLRTFSLERNSGRAAASMQNQEMAVELIGNPGAGQPVYRIYDPATVPTATIPLPPWDYSPASVNPRHNLSIFAITVTEIADFGWLERNINTLWPSWEYEATDVSKLKLAARHFDAAHKQDAALMPPG